MKEARFKLVVARTVALVAIVLGAVLAFAPVSIAVAEQEDSALAAGEADNASGQRISIAYGAIDKVRYPSKFGGYPLPSPDNPLRTTESVSSIPPSQGDIDRYYRSFDGYELLHTNYYLGCLTYYYYWVDGTSREEAEEIYQEEVGSLTSEDAFEENAKYYERIDKLTEAGDMETVEKLENERIGYEPQPEHLEPSVSQEEMIASSLADTERNLRDARARGNVQEIAQLERERAQKEAELAQERAANAQGDTDEVGEASSESAAFLVTAVVGIALVVVVIVAFVVRGFRGRDRS